MIPLEQGMKNLESLVGKQVIIEAFNASFEYHGDPCSIEDTDVSGEVKLYSGKLLEVKKNQIKIGRNLLYLSYNYTPPVETSCSSGGVTLVVHDNKVVFDCYYDTIPFKFKHKLLR